MRTTAIINLKGGVGKTVTAINMAHILATDHHKHVLLIDADSQHNTTDFFDVEPDGGMADYLAGTQEPYWVSNLAKVPGTNISLLPGSDELMDFDIGALRDGRANRQCLVELFSYIEEDNEAAIEEEGVAMIDHVIVDCPPAFNAAAAAALAAVDEVIIPLSLDAFSLAGVANMLRQVTNMRAINPRLRVAGMLLTKYRPGWQSWADEVRRLSDALPVYKTMIRDCRFATDSTFSGDPLTIYNPRCAAAVDYRRWVREYLGEECG